MMSRYRGRGFYDPLSEMNRLFAQVFGLAPQRTGDGGGQGDGGEEGRAMTAWTPAIDVLQRDGDLVVRAELPGVEPDDVDITVQNNVLTISGRISEEREEEREGYLIRERRAGFFRRSLQLPQGVDESNITARFDNGVLEVVIEGAAQAQEPRHVEVEGQQESGNGGQQSGRQQQDAQSGSSS
jgi:HSP20 family protein